MLDLSILGVVGTHDPRKRSVTFLEHVFGANYEPVGDVNVKDLVPLRAPVRTLRQVVAGVDQELGLVDRGGHFRKFCVAVQAKTGL